MATKKQIIIPSIILAIGIAGSVFFSSMDTPPEEKKDIDNTPIVTVSNISITPITLEVDSYGMVTPKYETELIAQVTGEIVELNDAFLQGGFVKKNALLARIDPNDYQAALIDAQASMATARAALQTEVAQGKVAEREWQKITDTSPTELSLRKPQLAQEMARVKAAQASVLRAERNLERTEIRAPYDAMISSRNIGLGSFVTVGSKIGHLLATDTAEIRLPVADTQLQFLAGEGVGAKAKILGEYAGKAVQWNAIIKRNEGIIDSTSRMGYLVAEFKDPYQLKKHSKMQTRPLRFGSYVNAKILGDKIEKAAILPRYLVVNGKVAILDNDSTLHYAKVDIVRQQGSNVIVSNGLVDGDRLIISALDYPVEGMKLALMETKKDLNEKNGAMLTESKIENANASVTTQESGE